MKTNAELFAQAQKVIPGGVNSPVRAFKSVGGTPVFIARAKGAYVYDESGKEYVDYVGSWGPMVLGHAHPDVLHAVQEKMQLGLSFGAPTIIETEMAEKICELLPAIEQVRMVNSGTEACMSAIRLARGFTKRDKIVKFEGGYHGHSDDLLVKAGSGLLNGGTPTSAGVPTDFAKHTLTATYNDLADVKKIFADNPGTIAAVIIEPVAGNMNCVPATQEFLTGLREVCDANGSLLIFDEVMCGFRVGLHCAQAYYNVKPDLTTLGKIIGGGMPVGAFGGRREIMQCLAPIGAVYQAGTLSGNPVAMAAGLANLNAIMRPGFYAELGEKTEYLVAGLREMAQKHKIPLATNSVCGMFGFFFTDVAEVNNFRDACNCDVQRFNKFFHAMLEEGIYWAPSSFEAAFMSIAHSKADLDKTIAAADRVFAKL